MMTAHQQPDWTLDQLLAGIVQVSAPAVLINAIALDSRAVSTGCLFLALDGQQQNGSLYIKAAIEQGATAVLTQTMPALDVVRHAQEKSVVLLAMPALNTVAGLIAHRFFAEPSKSLRLVGVTGTDGKTSVSQFIAQALSALNKTCGVIGTLGNGLYGQLEVTAHTTPDAITLNSLLAKFVNARAHYAAMEVSSHGLAQARVDGLLFDTAVLTNLARDHLDYHGTIEAYRAAKMRLFALPDVRTRVLNIDDVFGQAIKQQYPDAVTYSADINNKKSDIGVVHVQYSAQGLSLRIRIQQQMFEVECALLGGFNIANVLAVVAVLHGWKFSVADIRQAVASLQPVAGRMQGLQQNNSPTVIVDYAHTPQALEAALHATRAHTTGKVFCVFGAGGDRDVGKRPLMGSIAASLADRVIVTSDNPRSESAAAIADAIIVGMSNTQHVSTELNRATAIAQALAEAQAGDCILVAGKGHEDYQLIGQQRLAYSDIETVNALLTQYATPTERVV
ncbi:MAG: UDP-N-acetylmuramoyl-L-alanyl-D-glutamate--2,6-diaminopimelate ligase [Gammaproteobacteria bacterium]|nr:UDP-N-acetylmuramoyl-L-alanyl-D-glutamate--2,6-diaminopimelate ligase [Gammaproteobacteria bacterium]